MVIMCAEVEEKDGVIHITGDSFDEETGKEVIRFFEEHPGEKYNVLLDVDGTDLGTKIRKKILNDIIGEGLTPKIAVIDPPLKIKVFLKVVRNTGHKELKVFDKKEEGLEYVGSD